MKACRCTDQLVLVVGGVDGSGSSSSRSSSSRRPSCHVARLHHCGGGMVLPSLVGGILSISAFRRVPGCVSMVLTTRQLRHVLSMKPLELI
jgi:hypothetical protein